MLLQRIPYWVSRKYFVLPIILMAVIYQLLPFASQPAQAAATLTITPLTWDVVGLDSNNPPVGPYQFPVGARVCNTGNAVANNVTSSFNWDSANANINLQPGSPSSLPPASAGAISLNPTECTDFYYNIEVNRVAGSYNTTRQYHITASATSVAPVSTPAGRQLFIEHLISQNRNATLDMKYALTGQPRTSVPAGGTFSLLVGQTYDIELVASTATQGYEQLETFLTLSNTVFEITKVVTTYTADTSATVGNPNDKLYADACSWITDPTDPNYRSCASTGKDGGNINVVYTVRVLSGGGTTQSLNSLIYDFSGSSFHYNSDYSSSARFASIVDPASAASVSKQFVPATISPTGVSTVVFTLGNSSTLTLSGYSFSDALPTSPSAMTVASSPAPTSSGCGTPTVTAAAGSGTISVSNATVAGQSSCTISVPVTTAGTLGGYPNQTGPLSVGGINTGNVSNSATLTVDLSKPKPTATCTTPTTISSWSFTGSNTTPDAGSLAGSTATFVRRTGANAENFTTAYNGPAWTGYGWSLGTDPVPTAGTQSYFQFSVPTSQYYGVSIVFGANPSSNPLWASASSNEIYIWSSADSSAYTAAGSYTNIVKTASNNGLTGTAATTGVGTTTFRINARGASNVNTAPLTIDDVVVRGCVIPPPPTIAKTFTPATIAAGTNSVLQFQLTNPDTTALTGVTFSDTLPTGVTPVTGTFSTGTCGGTFNATGSTLNFTGGTINGNSSCTIQVSVTSSVSGPHTNISNFISSAQTGQNDTSTGSATASLTVLSPPTILKTFMGPILPNGTSTLTLTIANPNQSNSISGVAVADTFPTTPGQMQVAAVPATSNTCGGTFAPIAGATSITASGITLAAGASCTLQVNVTAPIAGNYDNIASVTHIVNGSPVGTNTSAARLVVSAPNPSLSLDKQIGTSATGPWSKNVTTAPGTQVWYQFTVENSGDVPVNVIGITDPDITFTGCPWQPAGYALPVAVAANDNHIITCVIGPVTYGGTLTNTATANGTYNATNVNSLPSSATFTSNIQADLTISKANNVGGAAIAGNPWNWTVTVTNRNNVVTFTSGQVILTDTLPNTNISYGAVTLVGAIGVTGTINCAIAANVLTCTAGTTVTLASTASFGAQFSATASAAGNYTNPGATTIVDPNNAVTESDETNNTATDNTVVVTILPDLTVAKTNNVSGATLTNTPWNWTVTVSNSFAAANFPLGSTILTDTLPGAVTYGAVTIVGASGVTGTINCGIAANVLTCTAGTAVSLSATGTFGAQFSATAAAGGNFTNTGTNVVVDPGGVVTESNEANNTTMDNTVVVTVPPDLTISKTNDAGGATTVGTPWNWTVKVNNSGNTAAFASGQVILTDTLPNTNITYGAVTIVGSTGLTGTVNCAIVANVLTCTAGTAVSLSATGTFGAQFSATATAAGSFTNLGANAIVDPNHVVTEGDENNNIGTDNMVVVSPRPDLTISKANDAGGVSIVGTPWNWTVTVNNSGNTANFAIGDVILTDALPNTSITYGAVTIAGSSGVTGTITCAITANVLTCVAGTAVSLSTAGTFGAQFSATATATGSFTNVGTNTEVDPNDVVPEGNETNNTATNNTVVVSPRPDLTVTKTNDVSGATTVGTPWNWTETVNNSGSTVSFVAGDVILSDTLPNTNITYGAVTIVNSSGVAGTVNCGITANVLTCTAGTTVTLSATGTFGAQFSATATAAASYGSTTTVDPNGVITEGDETNNTAADTVVVTTLLQPNLTINKANNVGGATTVGVPWNWTVTVSNSGAVANFAIGDTILTDTLPSPNVTYGVVTIVNSSGVTGTITCAIAANVLTCTAGTAVSLSTTGTFGAQFSATATAAGSFVNDGTNDIVDPNNAVTESNELNNNANDDTVIVTLLPDLTISKANSVGGASTVGVPWNWTVTVTNSGNPATFPLGSTILTDTLPSTSITYGAVSIVGAGGVTGTINCGITGNVLTCTASTAVTLSATGTFGAQFSATPTAAGSFTNPGASTRVDPNDVVNESDETNNTATTDNTVVVTVLPDLTISKANNVGGATTVGVPWNWTVTVSNSGAVANFAIGDTILTDTLPTPGVTYGAVTIVGATGVTGTINCGIAANALTCTAGTAVSLNAPGTFGAQFSATATAAGSFTNPGANTRVDPNGVVPESDETNNTATTDNTVVVTLLPDLTISKANSVGSASTVGVPWNWTVTVTNSSNPATFPAARVILRDTLPTPGVTYGAVTIVNSTGVTGTINCGITANVLTCTASGGPVTLSATGTFGAQFSATPTAAGNFTNTGSTDIVDPNHVVTEGDEANNTATDNTVVVSAQPDLTISKTNDVGGATTVGTPWNWTETVTNGGLAVTFAAGDTILSDTLPATNISYGTASLISSTGVTGNIVCNIGGTVLTCTASGGPVTLSATGTFAVQFGATATAAGSYGSTATVDPNTVVTESDETNNTATDSVTVTTSARPDLTVTKTNDVGGATTVGTPWNWTETVNNTGTTATFAAGDVILSDTVPGTNITYGAVTVIAPSGVSGAGTIACSITANVLTCTATGGPVILSATGTFSAQFSATASTAGSYGSTVTVDSGHVVTESNEGNNTATDLVTVTAAAINGHVFQDNNGNGTQDLGEPDLAGLTVTIAGPTNIVVTTNANGDYTAPVLAGAYSATVTGPAGSTLTTGNNPQTGLVVTTGTTPTTQVGFRPPAATGTLSGHVFTDTNHNGVQDPGEPNLAGLTVTITGPTTITATTDAAGNYSVTLPPGSYTVVVTDPSGTVLSTHNNPQTGLTVTAGGATTTSPVGFAAVTPTSTPASNQNPSMTPVINIADPVITKSGDPNIVYPGENLTWTITVTNQGNAAATKVIVNDNVPAILKILKASGAPNVIKGNLIVFTIGTINPGQVITLTVLTQVDANAVPPQAITNNVDLLSNGLDRAATATVQLVRKALPATGEHPDDPAFPSWGFVFTSVVLALVAGLKWYRRRMQ